MAHIPWYIRQTNSLHSIPQKCCVGEKKYVMKTDLFDGGNIKGGPISLKKKIYEVSTNRKPKGMVCTSKFVLDIVNGKFKQI